MFEKDYYFGKGSNYVLGYKMLKHKIIWRDKIHYVLKYKIGGRLLDVGCALGYFAKHMENRGFDVYGIDISEYAIETCRKTFKKNNFFAHNAENKLPFPKNYFDAITALDVLEHTKKPNIVLKNLVSVLKDDGILLLSLPLKLKGSLKRVAIDRDDTHISLMEEREIARLIEKNKMEIIKKLYYMNFFGLYTFPIFLKSLGSNILLVCRKQNYKSLDNSNS